MARRLCGLKANPLITASRSNWQCGTGVQANFTHTVQITPPRRPYTNPVRFINSIAGFVWFSQYLFAAQDHALSDADPPPIPGKHPNSHLKVATTYLDFLKRSPPHTLRITARPTKTRSCRKRYTRRYIWERPIQIPKARRVISLLDRNCTMRY